MNSKTILIAAAAVAGVAVLARRAQAGGLFTGDQQRLAGIEQLYASNRQQTAVVSDAVIASNWASIRAATQTQPDFWV